MTFHAQPLCYTGGHLDRVAVQRKNPDWTRAQLEHPDSIFVPIWRARNLINMRQDPRRPTAELCRYEVGSLLLQHTAHSILLGLDRGVPVFALDLSPIEETEAAELCRGGEFVDLRRVGPIMRPRDATLMAYARGMVHWHQQHVYCSVCGHLNAPHEGGYMRQCTNEQCKHRTFPRTDPAVIMLIEKPATVASPAMCLLGRHTGLPPDMYSTLAGFVEPGESLEEAVRREVLEETGIGVGEVTYQQSQPWPFPASIMLGFRGRALDERICLDQDELEHAAWFSADELRDFGEWGGDGAGRKMPRRDSIAWFLINTWLNEQTQGHR